MAAMSFDGVKYTKEHAVALISPIVTPSHSLIVLISFIHSFTHFPIVLVEFIVLAASNCFSLI